MYMEPYEGEVCSWSEENELGIALGAQGSNTQKAHQPSDLHCAH